MRFRSPSMSRAIAMALCLSVPVLGHAIASPGPWAPPDDPPAKPAEDIEPLLARWEARSKGVRSLSLKYRREEETKVHGIREYLLDMLPNRPLNRRDEGAKAVRITRVYRGYAHIKLPNLLYADACELKDGKAGPRLDERLVSDGKDLYQFNGVTRIAWISPLAPNKPQGIMECGPLPFLIDVAAIRATYAMTLAGEDSRNYVIDAVPKAAGRAQFSRARIELDKELLMPVKLRLWDFAGRVTITYSCDPADVEENREIRPACFDGAEMVKQIKRERKGAWNVVAMPALGP